MRDDRRVSDVPALTEGNIADGAEYVARRTAQWLADEHYSWAVCEPTTGELLAEVGVTPASGELTAWTRDGHEDVLATATDAISRFAQGALGITVTRVPRP